MPALARVLVLAILALVVVAIVGVLAFNAHDQATLTAQARATAQVSGDAAAGIVPVSLLPDLPRDLNVATVHRLNGRQDVVVVDIRSETEYESGHVPGAMSAPAAELETRLQAVPRDIAVVLACSSGRSSGAAVDRLLAAGYTNVHQMVGGMRAWRQAGLEIEE